MDEAFIAKLLVFVPLWGCALGFIGMGINLITGFQSGTWMDAAGEWGFRLCMACLGFLGLLILVVLTVRAFAS